MNTSEKAVYIVRCIQRYRNWPEILMALAAKQSPRRVILRGGIRFEGAERFPWVGQVNEIFFQRGYTPPPLHIKSDDIVLDVGAHVGVFTVFAASRTHNAVYAFEPFPDTFEILTRNVSINRLKSAVPYRSALGDRIGSAQLLLSPIADTRHVLSDAVVSSKLLRYRKEHSDFESIMPGEQRQSLEVPVTTLKEIFDSNQIEQVGFLKMNCEGSEGLVLASTPRDYLERIRSVAIDFHDHLSRLSHRDMQDLLEATGFTTFLAWDGKSPGGSLFGWREH